MSLYLGGRARGRAARFGGQAHAIVEGRVSPTMADVHAHLRMLFLAIV